MTDAARDVDAFVPPGAGKTIRLGPDGSTTFQITPDRTGGAFAIMEHRVPPGLLAGPPHTHSNEDEALYVLEAVVSVLLGDDVFEAPPGSVVFKPRGIAHTFWNGSSTPARVLDIIYPGAYAKYFEELVEFIPADGPPDISGILDLWAKYGIKADLAKVPEIVQTYDVKLPGM